MFLIVSFLFPSYLNETFSNFIEFSNDNGCNAVFSNSISLSSSFRFFNTSNAEVPYP